MHLPNDPREQEMLGTPGARSRFLVELLDTTYEAALAGLMREFGCSRGDAVRRLAEGYERRDREKLEALRRSAETISRAG